MGAVVSRKISEKEIMVEDVVAMTFLWFLDKFDQVDSVSA